MTLMRCSARPAGHATLHGELRRKGGQPRSAFIGPYLDPVWGDRRQEVVFIGADPMDEAWIRKELDACLVDSTVFAPERWRNLPDPFASWNRQAA
nr:GTP-binding protein [Rhizobium leguminosarum]